jgi:hypothetical protein
LFGLRWIERNWMELFISYSNLYRRRFNSFQSSKSKSATSIRVLVHNLSNHQCFAILFLNNGEAGNSTRSAYLNSRGCLRKCGWLKGVTTIFARIEPDSKKKGDVSLSWFRRPTGRVSCCLRNSSAACRAHRGLDPSS